jgi:hypothetical protein
LSRLPKTCPRRATVVQRKGSSASRRASGVSLQKARRRASGSATPPSFLFRSASSAPRKTSCQRRPSVVTSTTLRVVGRGLASSDLAGRTKACNAISRGAYRRECGMGAFHTLPVIHGGGGPGTSPPGAVRRGIVIPIPVRWESLPRRASERYGSGRAWASRGSGACRWHSCTRAVATRASASCSNRAPRTAFFRPLLDCSQRPLSVVSGNSYLGLLGT